MTKQRAHNSGHYRRAAAILYSVIASARRHDLDVWQYFGDILRRLAELERLLPDAWYREQENASAPTDDQPANTAA